MAFKMKGFDYPGEIFKIDKSKIDGVGVIASRNIRKGEFIGTAFTDEYAVKPKIGKIQHDTRTRLGRTLNHQQRENAIQKSEKNSLNVYAKNSIKKGEEITINYKNAPDYVDKNTEGFK